MSLTSINIGTNAYKIRKKIQKLHTRPKLFQKISIRQNYILKYSSPPSLFSLSLPLLETALVKFSHFTNAWNARWSCVKMTTSVKQRKVSRSKGNEDERNIIVSKEMKDHVIIKKSKDIQKPHWNIYCLWD